MSIPTGQSLSAAHLLADCKRRMDEAKKKSEDAYWMNRPWSMVEKRMEEYHDRKCEDETALSANDKLCVGGPVTYESKQDANPPFAASLG